MNTRSSLVLIASLCLVSHESSAETPAPIPSSAASAAPAEAPAADTASDAGAAAIPAPETPQGTAGRADVTATAVGDRPATELAQEQPSAEGNANGKVKKNKKANKKANEKTKADKKDSAAGETAEADAEMSPAELDESDAVSAEQETLDGDAGTGDSNTKATLGRFRALLQLRYKYSYIDPDGVAPAAAVAHEQRATVREQDGYDIQRAFLRYVARPVKQVEAKMLVDFAELRHNNVRQSFKLAYLQIHATKRLQFDIGLLKRTFSLLELLPISDHELADVGPTDSWIKDQGYGGRDIGAIVRYRPLPKQKWLMISAGAFRGDLDEGYDTHPLKLITARIESFPWRHLRLGVNGAWRPYDNLKMLELEDATGAKYFVEGGTMSPGKAYGADATLMFKRLQIRAEGLYGDRTDPLRGASNHFAAGWIVVAPNFKVGSVRFVPAGKFEVLDVKPEGNGGRRVILTGVFGVVPVKNLRLLVDVTRSIVDAQTLSMSNVPWTKGNNVVYRNEPSSTAGTLQVQYQF